MAGLKKLEIIAYKDRKFSSKTGNSFTMMVNPANYSENKGIVYAVGHDSEGGNLPVYKRYKNETIKIEFFLDNMGVFANWMTKRDPDKPPLSAIVKKLETTIYTYLGSVHESPYLNVTWGTLNFKGRLNDFTINYLLFTPEGEPLRAKVNLEIMKYTDQETQNKLKNKSSPDLSHFVTIKDGDTLPALCRDIYKNEAYCMEVARINGLTGFRRLEPGLRLLFPPLSNE